MRIGIDIDGVLTDLEEFEIDYGSKYFYEKGILEDVKTKINFNYEELYMDEKYSNEFWFEAIQDYIKIRPRNFACEVINKLKEDGNVICIITNRISDLSYCDISPDNMKKIELSFNH